MILEDSEMPAKKEYTAEFKEQSVRFVFEQTEAEESGYSACARLGPKLNVKAVTLYNWVKRERRAVQAGRIRSCKMQRAAALDRQSKK